MKTRECEFCKDWTEEDYILALSDHDYICSACNGTREVSIEDCFCYTNEQEECDCNADWRE